MKNVKTLILRTAGTNCDKETAHAFKTAGSKVELSHINHLVRNKKLLSGNHILAVPGGFSYGDDIASGKVLANELKYALKNEIKQFIDEGKLIIGICNGFQVLVKMGMLPNIDQKREPGIEATLGLNDSGKFEDRWVYLRKNNGSPCVWVNGLPEIIYAPVAHAEGKFIPDGNKMLNSLKRNGQIVFTYCDASGNTCGYPLNPNGSVADIAGICDVTGRILGMMPHPERHVSYLQHPNWRRLPEGDSGLGIGLHIFKNGVNFVKEKLL